MKKRSVGVVLFTRVRGKVVAVLHRRGEFTFTDDLDVRDESWPGGCQVSSHGRFKDGDGDDLGAVIRETTEELGETAAQLISERRDRLTILSQKDDDKEQVTTYGLLIDDPKELLPYVRLGSESGGLVLADREREILDLKTFNKAEGVTDRRTVAMFADEIAAVRKGFEQYADAA